MYFASFARHLAALALIAAATTTVWAETVVDYEVEALGSMANHSFAPYYIASLRHGVITQASTALMSARIEKPLDCSRRFDFALGVEAIGGYASSTEYQYYIADTKTWHTHALHPSRAWLQQLYGSVKYRGVVLEAGMRERTPSMLNFELSSGDLIESGNARPIPQVRLGFIDFQDVPFTRGWVQIAGVVAYGKYTDDSWLRQHCNRYRWHINTGSFYTYKHCHFRTNPHMPLSLTVGMQLGGSYGGTTQVYQAGQMLEPMHFSSSPKAMLKMFLPIRNEGSDYYTGSTLGSWDALLRFRLPNGTLLKAYIEKPFEDGSGIGWMNGFDGLWGFEIDSCNPDAAVAGAVIEYIDFTHQSGPIHWSPDDNPGTTITSHATGGDDLYNNHQFNSWMNYGMGIGSPFVKSPIYNTDGYLGYVDNLVRGFHFGVKGHAARGLDYRMLMSYRKGWGTSRVPTTGSREDFSLLAEATYRLPRVKGLTLKGQFALDAGRMFGDNVGACLSLSYNGNFTLK